MPELGRHKALGVDYVPPAQNRQSGADRRAKVGGRKQRPWIAGLGELTPYEFWRETAPDCGA